MNEQQRTSLDERDQALHRELEALPELAAPGTLIPRVMDQIRGEARVPWYRLSFWQWPLALRAAALVAMVAVVGGVAYACPLAWETLIAPPLAAAKTEVLAWWNPLADATRYLFQAGSAFWRDYLQNILLAVALLLMATYFTFLAAGTAVYRLAWRRTQ